MAFKKVSLDEIEELARDAKDDLWDDANELGRDPKIYLHWTAGRFTQDFDDYHICIHGCDYRPDEDGNPPEQEKVEDDGAIYVSTEDFSEELAHTWHRNTGSIGVTIDCGYGASTDDLGDYAPTEKQIEVMAQVIVRLCRALEIPIDRNYVMTHAEAADNLDKMLPEGDEYGPLNGCERWDLQFLGTEESPEWTTDYDSPATGGNVLRGKAIWYANQG